MVLLESAARALTSMETVEGSTEREEAKEAARLEVSTSVLFLTTISRERVTVALTNTGPADPVVLAVPVVPVVLITPPLVVSA